MKGVPQPNHLAGNNTKRNRTAFSTLKRKQLWCFTIKRHQHKYHGLDKKVLCNYERGAFISYHR
ncbi:hypothetical protein DKZ32_10825 [Limosilactobacillus reuteri]|nr:hypothetical protein DKZ33_10810 [Limosilactobacillus reuteri]PWT57283.1 hypothetical protein DKZ32_10825 [Limosilactobacillus reuteri]